MKPPFRQSLTKRRRQAAFTLLEIIIVIAILGLLVGLGVTNYDKVFGTARNDIAKTFVSSSMKMPLTSYRMDMGDYPSTAEGLQALATAPQSRADRWRGPYVIEGKVPLDPWGEPYQYRYPGQRNKDSYDLWSKGADRQDGTADDVGNWSTGSEAK